MPWLWSAFQPVPSAHAAHFFACTSEDEVAWRENYRLWMRFVDDFAARGGSVEPGKPDLLVVEADPLADLKVLYGTGAVRLAADGTLGRISDVRWTIKAGVVHDTKALREEEREEVAAAKAADTEAEAAESAESPTPAH